MDNLSTNLMLNVVAPQKAKTFVNNSNSSAHSIYERLCKKEATIAVVGLGYVGLPIAIEFAKHFRVIGFDINQQRINQMKQGIDPSCELPQEVFLNKDISYTANPRILDHANVVIVAVPTPVAKDKAPNLTPLSKACETIGKTLNAGDLVVFESTVYPGCTEEVCIPILEQFSGLTFNKDFKVGYSPERINPGDKVHTLCNITKIVSGSDNIAEEEISKIYKHIIKAGIHLAPSIKVAEAAKILENTQRDVNIALMNEVSKFFSELDINTHDVLKAAGTKWNFLNFYPGLVGGHCIGVDPYYLIHKAKVLGLNLPVISSSRAVNDSMPNHVVQKVAMELEQKGKKLDSAKVLVLGATFKENVSDLRNSKAAEMTQLLEKVAQQVDIIDPNADPIEMNQYYDLELKSAIGSGYDAIIYAVNHREFEQIDWDFIHGIASEDVVVFDFKQMLGAPRDGKISYSTL